MARRDFVYYIPGLTGWIKHVTAFSVRLAIKILVDTAGLLIARNPYEMGGCYFSFNLVISQASCWITAALYVEHFRGENKVDAETIFLFLGALQAVWAVTLVLFFSKIKRAYWKTFYSTQSGRQCTVAYFLDNEDDGTRVIVFTTHADLWSDIKDDVRAFTLANWARWEVEKPDWFTEGFKAGVPDDYMPKGALDELNRTSVGGKRRRSSVGLLMLEGAGTSTDGTGRNCEDDCAATG